MSARIGVVAAAGPGTRAHPKTALVPKVLLEAGGKPLIVRTIELMRDELGIRDILVVVGHLAGQVRAALGDGGTLGVALRYVDNPAVRDGLGTVLAAVRPYVNEPFVLMLGDELYLDSNHAELAGVEGPYRAVCAVQRCEDAERIRRNYTAVVSDGRITALVEKPEDPVEPLLGCGTYLMAPEIFADLDRTPVSERSGSLELTDVLNTAARSGRVLPFSLRGDYVNVNTLHDLRVANALCRERMLARARTTLVIPAYEEADSIGHVIDDFLPHVDEVLVMDNCSSDGTADIARRRGARVESRPLAGYGDALRQGMALAEGDVIALTEADATFRAKDLPKLRAYLRDADMVVGTRTSPQMIESGANMEGALRVGNIAVGKLIEALWWEEGARFTDVGCTYRILWRDAYERIAPHLTSEGPALSPEMLIEVLRAHRTVIEVPVSYYPRRGGASKLSGTRWTSARTGMEMLSLILRKRLALD